MFENSSILDRNHPRRGAGAACRLLRLWRLGIVRQICILVLLACSPAARADLNIAPPPSAAQYVPDALKNISVTEHLKGALPLDAGFVDDHNQRVTLRQYFNGTKPVILQLGYYKCPMLCDLISQGATKSLKDLKELTAGKDFDIIFISVDPNEDPSLAQKKKASYVAEYDRPGSQDGWHFLTGGQTQIDQVAKAVGFEYKWVAAAKQFSHPAAIMLCTPDGKLSRYLYGVQFPEENLRLGLVEASQGKIGSTTDHFLLTCFVYDGKQGKYAVSAMRLMRFAGVLTMIVMAVVLVRLFRRDAQRRAGSLPSEE
jgi:protein SCO1/2